MLKHDLTKSGELTTVRLTGEIGDDVDAAFAQVLAGVETRAVTLECAGIQAMNSMGIAAWCAFVKALEKKATVELREVPAIMVHFAGMVRGFFGKNAALRTVGVPYYCASCRAGATATLMVAAVRAKGALPEHPCPKCGRPLAPEVETEGYVDALLKGAGGGGEGAP